MSEREFSKTTDRTRHSRVRVHDLVAESCAKAPTDKRGHRWLVAIAIFRLFKAAILIAIAIGAFALVNSDLPALADRFLEWADLDRESEAVQAILERLPGVTPHMLQALGGGAIAYAALFCTEAYGLLRERVWAEWLTIVATSSFIPLELIEVLRHVNVLRASALGANVAIVAFLVLRRVKASSLARKGEPSLASG